MVLVILSASASLSCGVTEILGCTDFQLTIYADATTDDGSCIISGCMDASADNFNSSANTPGDCIIQDVQIHLLVIMM